MITMIREIVDSKQDPPKKSIFKFENSNKAAQHNGRILESCNYVCEKVLHKQRGTNIFYGSKFRNISTLSKLFGYHDNWIRFKLFLSEGTDTTFTPIEEEIFKKTV